jgi:AGCS family alanine or glycine:cation symporter
VSSILAHPDISYADGGSLTRHAFAKIPYIGSPLLAFGIFTFAFSTILGWSYYGTSAVRYLTDRERKRKTKAPIVYRMIYIGAVFVGSIVNLNIIWNIADTTNALMAIPNLICLLLLSNVAAKETKKYLWGHHLDDVTDDDRQPEAAQSF